MTIRFPPNYFLGSKKHDLQETSGKDINTQTATSKLQQNPPLFILASENHIINLIPENVEQKHTLIPKDRDGSTKISTVVHGAYGTIPTLQVATLDQVLYQLTTLTFHHTPVAIQLFRVTIPKDTTKDEDEIGHHDRVSNFSLYQGYRAISVKLEEAYQLSSENDIHKLIEFGFFANNNRMGPNTNTIYGDWLVRHNEYALYQVFYDFIYNSNHNRTAAQYNRLEFIKTWINNDDLRDENYAELFDEAIQNKNWELVNLVKDRLSLEKMEKSLLHLLETNNRKHFKELTTQYNLLEHKDIFLKFLRHVLIHNMEDFLDYELHQVKQQQYKKIDPRIISLCCFLDIWPTDKMAYQNDILNAESDELQKHSIASTEVNEQTQEFKKHCQNNRFFICKMYIENQILTQSIKNQLFLISCEHGALGLVKILIDIGADIHYWHDYSIKYANKHSYNGLKKYLLKHGMSDEVVSKYVMLSGGANI